MKNILFTMFYLLFFSSFIIGQSKKEQIINLNKRVDSLDIIISKQSITINQQNSYQIKLKNNLTNNKEKIENLNKKIDNLIEEISFYKEEFDSLKNSFRDIYNSTKKTFIDKRDKKTYRTVKIGNQTWMAENLAYNTGKGCWAYDDDIYNVNKYGYLYSWKIAKNVCPVGWHLPSKNEFETLLNNVGGRGVTAFNSLMLDGDSGFDILLCGWRAWGENKYIYFGEVSRFWSSTKHDEEKNWGLNILTYDEDTEGKNADTGVGLPYAGFSVRCIQD